MSLISLESLRRYGLAVLAVSLATVLRLALDPILGEHLPFLMFFIAIVVTAWYGSFGPSLLAVCLSWLAFNHVILGPNGSVPFFGSRPALLFGFFIIGITIASLGEAARVARIRSRVEATRARRALDDLRAQREWFRITLDSIADAVITTDPGGLVVSLNPVAEDLSGWGASEAEGLPLKQVLRTLEENSHRTDDIPIAQFVLGEEIIASDGPSVLVARDGTMRTIERNVTLLKDDRGQVMGAAVVFRDVTERRRVELAQRSLAAIVEFSDDAILSKDTEGIIKSWNAAAERLYGYPAAEVIGKPFAILVPAERNNEVAEGMRRLRLGERLDHFETQRRKKQGDLIDVTIRYSPIQDDAGRLVGTAVVVRDISQQKMAEGKLREVEQRFSRFMHHLPGLAWIKDLEGRYVYANEAALKAFRTPRSNLYGKRDEDVFDPETAALFRANDLKALSCEFGIQTVEAVVQDDGMLHHSIVSKFPVLGQDGQVALIGGIAIDITDRMRMEQSLRESDKRKDEFIATLAHELRNPLAPIQNGLQLMKQPTGDGPALEAERAMAERQVRHLARLVDDLMDVSRINRGNIELRKEVAELATVVARAAESVGSVLQERGHELTVSLTEEPIHLEADPTRLEQVLGNLLNNAIKYTDPGGEIALDVERNDHEAIVRVRDNGIGIEPEMHARIFEMFIQGGRHTDRSQGGLGIGLGLVKRLVELHGGTIKVHSRGLGAGSEFEVRLPILTATPHGPNPDLTERVIAPRPEVKPARRRVLVVDDNHDAANSLARVLVRLYGQEVQVAHDGPSALDTAQEFRPELILLDIGMPGMDGNEVTRRLRAQPDFEKTLIVALTGWGQESDVKQSRQAGFDQHLVKPANPDAIRALLTDPRPSLPDGDAAV